jgi:hypothetical protein
METQYHITYTIQICLFDFLHVMLPGNFASRVFAALRCAALRFVVYDVLTSMEIKSLY